MTEGPSAGLAMAIEPSPVRVESEKARRLDLCNQPRRGELAFSCVELGTINPLSLSPPSSEIDID